MYFQKQFILMTAIALVGTAAAAPDEAAQLGGPVLTQWGAERAGNKEGTIPAYTGERSKAPATWNPAKPGQRPDPFNEKPLFTITAQNAAQYADKLDGSIELFKRYPDYRMDIYPTHRTWTFPQYVLDNTAKNLTACKATDKTELKLEGCYGGFPFPLPKTGNQVMWNHLLTYQAWSMKGHVENWLVPSKGEAVMVERGNFIYNWPYYDPDKKDPHPSNALYFRFLGKDEAPARLAGGQMLVHDAVDQLNIRRAAWLYMTGRRWVKIAAELAYDTPNPYTANSATMDDASGFTGALDRYNFKLIGKKEKFIYYNNFDMVNQASCSAEKVTATKNFPNPACIRWELHRVWVVEATLKPDAKHLYRKRIFYWDEDTYAAGQVENYDGSKMFRLNNIMAYPYFEAPGGFAASDNFQDLDSNTYTVTGVGTCTDCGWQPVLERIPEQVFSPDAMAGGGVR